MSLCGHGIHVYRAAFLDLDRLRRIHLENKDICKNESEEREKWEKENEEIETDRKGERKTNKKRA